jgi:hypothetical protein
MLELISSHDLLLLFLNADNKAKNSWDNMSVPFGTGNAATNKPIQTSLVFSALKKQTDPSNCPSVASTYKDDRASSSFSS